MVCRSQSNVFGGAYAQAKYFINYQYIMKFCRNRHVEPSSVFSKGIGIIMNYYISMTRLATILQETVVVDRRSKSKSFSA